MSSNRLRSSLLGFCSLVIVTSLLCVEAHQDEVNEAPNWPWEKPHTFICPTAFGTFSDPEDCNFYYVCVAKMATHRQCRRLLMFDKNLRRCVSVLIAVCDDSGKEATTKEPKTIGTTPDDAEFYCPSMSGSYLHPTDCTKYFTCTFFFSALKICPDNELFDGVKKQCRPAEEVDCGSRIRPTGKEDTTKEPKTIGTTPDDEEFYCPSMSGSYLHPTDCTKYFTCTFFFSALKICPDNELFDGVKKQCRPAEEVHCGSRIRPTEATTLADTTPEITTPTTTETIAEETTTPTTTTTTPTPIVPSTTTTEPPIPTSTKGRVTAPDTDCDKDDVDCIIDDLGEKPEWFVCETDMGSYPHPATRKLFIFCLNWKPSVKKCGQDLVFSEDLMTCVSP